MAIGQPLGEALNEIGLTRRKFFFLPTEAAAKHVVRQTTQTPATFCKISQISLPMILTFAIIWRVLGRDGKHAFFFRI